MRPCSTPQFTPSNLGESSGKVPRVHPSGKRQQTVQLAESRAKMPYRDLMATPHVPVSRPEPACETRVAQPSSDVRDRVGVAPVAPQSGSQVRFPQARHILALLAHSPLDDPILIASDQDGFRRSRPRRQLDLGDLPCP